MINYNAQPTLDTIFSTPSIANSGSLMWEVDVGSTLRTPSDHVLVDMGYQNDDRTAVVGRIFIHERVRYSFSFSFFN